MNRNEMIRENKERTEQLRKKYSRKLEAVQDLKRQYYIGTGDVKQYLEAYETIDDRLSDFASRIDRNLPKEFSYRATPERVISIMGILSDFEYCYLSNTVGKDIYSIEEAYNSKLFKELNLVNLLYIFKEKEMRDLELDFDIDKFLIEIFSQENKNNLNDKNFISETLSYFVDRIVGYLNGIDRNDLAIAFMDTCNDLNGLYENLTIDDISLIMKKKSIKRQRNSINYGNILERIIRDQVENRIEYRRSLLLLYAEASEIESSNDGILLSKDRLRKSNERLKKLMEINAPRVFISRENEMIKEKKCLLHILQSEKRWLDKILSNGG